MDNFLKGYEFLFKGFLFLLIISLLFVLLGVWKLLEINIYNLQK